MTFHRHKAHHRPSVRRLPRALGTMRWVSSCDHCSFYITTTFWRAALIKANAHSMELR